MNTENSPNTVTIERVDCIQLIKILFSTNIVKVKEHELMWCSSYSIYICLPDVSKEVYLIHYKNLDHSEIAWEGKLVHQWEVSSEALLESDDYSLFSCPNFHGMLDKNARRQPC